MLCCQGSTPRPTARWPDLERLQRWLTSGSQRHLSGAPQSQQVVLKATLSPCLSKAAHKVHRDSHLDGREADPGHAVRGAAIVLRVEEQDATKDEERCRVRPRDDLQCEHAAF